MKTVEFIETDFSESLAQRLAAPPSFPMTLYWLGQAGFVIRAASRRLIIDPYLSDSLAEKYRGQRYPHERMMPAPITPAGLGPIDLVLCTHQHTDHMDPATLAPLAALNPSLRFVVPEASLPEARRRIGVEDDRLCALDVGRSVEPLPGVRVSAIPAAHETLETDANGRHMFLGYIIDVAGARIVHSGDTIPFDGLAGAIADHRPCLALLPVNGRSDTLRAGGVPGNLNLDEAIDLCVNCQIPAMIAHHHGMFSFNTIAPETIDRRAAELVFPPKITRARTGVEYALIPGTQDDSAAY